MVIKKKVNTLDPNERIEWVEISHEKVEDFMIELFGDGSGGFNEPDEWWREMTEGFSFSKEELPHVIEMLEEFITEAKKRIA